VEEKGKKGRVALTRFVFPVNQFREERIRGKKGRKKSLISSRALSYTVEKVKESDVG